MKDLSLAEELILIALDDETGKLLPHPDRALDYALAGAIVADLTMAGLLRVTADRVEIIKDNDTVGSVEDIGFEEIKSIKVKTLRGILAHLAGDSNQLREQIINQLLTKGVLKEEDREFLWVFHFSRYPVNDREPEEAVKERLRRRIKLAGDQIPERDHILFSLIHICQLAKTVFVEEESDALREQFEVITSSDTIGVAVRECLQQIQQAIMEIRTYSGI